MKWERGQADATTATKTPDISNQPTKVMSCSRQSLGYRDAARPDRSAPGGLAGVPTCVLIYRNDSVHVSAVAEMSNDELSVGAFARRAQRGRHEHGELDLGGACIDDKNWLMHQTSCRKLADMGGNHSPGRGVERGDRAARHSGGFRRVGWL